MTYDRPYLPAPKPGLLARQIGDEILVVHPGTQVAHSLSGLAARVWAAAGGAPLPDADPAAIEAAVDGLIGLDLLVADRGGVTRRRLLKVGGAAAAAIGVLSVPLPAAAASCSGGPTVTGVNPATMTAGTSNQNETITGTGFVTGASVMVTFSSGNGGTPATVTTHSIAVVNSTTITAQFNATSGTGNGKVWRYTITVTNPNGCSGTSGPIFTVTS